MACGACAVSACGGGSAVSAPPDPSVEGALAGFDAIPVGSAVAAETSDGRKVLVVRTSETEVAGFSAVCPHQGCNVEPEEGALACPCHGSVFGLDGSVTRGPAESPLTAYPVRVQDGQVVPA